MWWDGRERRKPNWRDRLGDHERVSKYSGSLQSIIVSAGLIFGGIWGFLKFDRLNEAEIADAQVQELRKALADVQITGRVATSPAAECLLTVTARIQNQGRRRLHLDFSEPPLTLAYMEIARDGSIHHGVPWSLPVWAFGDSPRHVIELPSSELVPGEITQYSFLTTVQKKMVVLAEFRVPVIEVVPADSPKRETRALWHWAGRAFLPTCGIRESPSPNAMAGPGR